MHKVDRLLQSAHIDVSFKTADGLFMILSRSARLASEVWNSTGQMVRRTQRSV